MSSPSLHLASSYKSYGKEGYRDCKGGPIKVTFTPYRKLPIISHDEKNMRMCRPMSPHLDIYGPTVPAMTSIAQRATGIAISALSFILAAAELLYPNGTCGLITFIHCLGIPEVVAIAGKTVLAIVFLHHYFNGVRFVFFNMAMGLDIKTAYKTAYGAIALSCICGVLCGLLGHYKF